MAFLKAVIYTKMALVNMLKKLTPVLFYDRYDSSRNYKAMLLAKVKLIMGKQGA